MTEETIKNIIDESIIDDTETINRITKQLLEQHEAEMVEAMKWATSKGYYFSESHGGWWVMRKGQPQQVVTISANLLTLFKNRNK